MNKKIIFSVMLICLLAFVAVMAFSQSNQNVRWEYHFVTVNTVSAYEVIAQANALGEQGWELVSGSIKGGSNEKFLSFKRRLP